MTILHGVGASLIAGFPVAATTAQVEPVGGREDRRRKDTTIQQNQGLDHSDILLTIVTRLIT